MPTTKERSKSGQQGGQGGQTGQPEMTLSEAASIMRDDNASPEDRSRAASVMGREGGKHSHDRDAKSNRANADQQQQTTADQNQDQQQSQGKSGDVRQKETT